MGPKQNSKPWIIAGIAVVFLLVACVACVVVFYGSWNWILAQAPEAGPPPQPRTAISAQNIGKVQELYEFKQRAIITSLAWSPDGRLLASGGASRNPSSGQAVDKPQTVMLWDVTTGRELHSLAGVPGDVYRVSVAFSPDGKLLAAGSKEGITIWNVEDGSKLRTITDLPYPADKIAFSPDGQSIVAGEGSIVELWDVATGSKIRSLSGYDGFFYARDGKLLGWSEPDAPPYGLKFSELETGREVWASGTGGNLTALSHDGKLLTSQLGVSELMDDQLSLVDATNGSRLRTLGSIFRPSCISFTSDDSLVAAVQAKGLVDLLSAKLDVWDVQSGNKYVLDTRYVDRCAAFSPDSRFLALGTDIDTVQLWGIKP